MSWFAAAVAAIIGSAPWAASDRGNRVWCTAPMMYLVNGGVEFDSAAVVTDLA